MCSSDLLFSHHIKTALKIRHCNAFINNKTFNLTEGHLKALDMIASTAENLQGAIDGETFEFSKMYPPMLEQANAEGHKVKIMFRFALDVEAVHADIYKKALEAVKKGVDLDVSEFFLCPVCGYIELGKAPDNCPVCGAKGSTFVQVA